MEGKTQVSIGLKNVEKDIDDSKVEIQKLEVELDGTNDPHERIELNRRLTAKEQRLTSLQEQKNILLRREGRKSAGNI